MQCIYTLHQLVRMKRKGIVAETRGEWPVNLDFTKDNKLFGIEILQASKVVDIEYLRKLKFIEFK